MKKFKERRQWTREVIDPPKTGPARERDDLLNVGDEAHAFARIVASRNTRLPMSIGVFGEWGSGKTFFMGLVSDHVEQLSARAKNGKDADTLRSRIDDFGAVIEYRLEKTKA